MSEQTTAPLPNDGGRVAVIDIGSNTVRMVVFDGGQRVPFLTFNEKSACGLGRGLSQSGRLNPEGVERARRLLVRFQRLTAQMALRRVHILATAAVREAEDGAPFAHWVESLFNQPVEILSGPDEARLAAMGVLCGSPEAEGLVADLGGGSLDLVELRQGRLGDFAATLPFGHLKIAEAMAAEKGKLRRRIDRALADIPQIATCPGGTLHAVGGSWRALASLFINLTEHPLHIIDHFSLPADRILSLIKQSVLGSSKRERKKIFVSARRADSLPAAAVVLASLVEASGCHEVLFSGYGLREGRFFDSLPPKDQDLDPLIAGCRGFTAQRSRFAPHDLELLDWMDPVFHDDTPRQRQIRQAICILADIAWREHPDYRAEHAFLRVLRMPLPGLAHEERVEMALAAAYRYNHGRNLPSLKTYLPMIDDARQRRAMAIGIGLRLAHILSGSVPGLVEMTRLNVEGDQLLLKLPPGGALYRSETVDRRLNQMAKAAGLSGSRVD